MSLTREQKAVQIDEIVELTKECKSFVIVRASQKRFEKA